MSEWTKLPAIEEGCIKGCLNCGVRHSILPMDAIIAVGFGSADVTRDGAWIMGEQGDEYPTVADAEKAAAADPNHDWRISYVAPLYESEYQRQGDAHWVLVSKGRGFA
jgi:hypothetical protein